MASIRAPPVRGSRYSPRPRSASGPPPRCQGRSPGPHRLGDTHESMWVGGLTDIYLGIGMCGVGGWAGGGAGGREDDATTAHMPTFGDSVQAWNYGTLPAAQSSPSRWKRTVSTSMSACAAGRDHQGRQVMGPSISFLFSVAVLRAAASSHGWFSKFHLGATGSCRRRLPGSTPARPPTHPATHHAAAARPTHLIWPIWTVFSAPPSASRKPAPPRQHTRPAAHPPCSRGGTLPLSVRSSSISSWDRPG